MDKEAILISFAFVNMIGIALIGFLVICSEPGTKIKFDDVFYPLLSINIITAFLIIFLNHPIR